VYCHKGYAYANVCDVSAEGLDMLALVDLFLVGDDPNLQFSYCSIGVYDLNPELGSLWLKASETLGSITSAEGLHDRL
jgi:hypothetical protein